MMQVKEVREWLSTLDNTEEIGITDGGLCLATPDGGGIAVFIWSWFKAQSIPTRFILALVSMIGVALLTRVCVQIYTGLRAGHTQNNTDGTKSPVDAEGKQYIKPPSKLLKNTVGSLATSAVLLLFGLVFIPTKSTDQIKGTKSGVSGVETVSAATPGPQQPSQPSVTVNTQGGQANTQVGNNNKQTIINNLPPVKSELIVGTIKPDSKPGGPIVESMVQECAKAAENLNLPAGIPITPFDPMEFKTQLEQRIPKNALRVYLGKANLAFTTKPDLVVLKTHSTDLLAIHENPEGGISVDAKLFSKDVLVDIVGSEFHINTTNDTYWRYKSTDHSLAVYNKQADEVLNIQFVNRLVILVRGIFRYSENVAFRVLDDKMLVADQAPVVCSVSGSPGGAAFNIQ